MNNRHHTYYTIIGSGIAILFSMLYAFLGAQLESAKIICYVIGGIGLLSLIAALLDLIINLKREKAIGAFLYASAGATVALVILGILAFNIPTVEKSSWDMLIVISGLALIITGLLAMGATALEVIRYRANKFVEKNWNEFAEAADIKEEVTYEEMDPDNVIDVDAVDVEDKK